MIKRFIILGIALVAGSIFAQTTQTVNLGTLQLPPITVNGAAIQQPPVPLPSFVILFHAPKSVTNFLTVTNWVNFTNRYSVTNWTFLTVTQTNVQQVLVTNVLPNYIPFLVVTGQSTFNSIYVSTNHP